MAVGTLPFVIGISSVTGGGKTVLAGKLMELLTGSMVIRFDDYDDTTIHPDDLYQWAINGADYNAWKTPQLTEDLRRLKSGWISLPPNDSPQVSYVIFDAPLGRAHNETGQFIDFMIFIDTPLDVALARRILRDYFSELSDTGDQGREVLEADLKHYLVKGRLPYLEMYKQIKPDCDLILDGTLPLDVLAEEVLRQVEAKQKTISY